MIIIGLGSNAGDRLQHLRDAYKILQKSKFFDVAAVAPIYSSQAQLPDDAPCHWNRPYLNTAVRCSTTLKPQQALKQLKAMEVKMGRDAKHEHWAPRVIDIDILFWSEYLSLNSEALTLPHSFLFERPFALWPLEDLVPEKIMVNLVDINTHRTAKEISKAWGSRFDRKFAPFKTYQLNHRIDTPYMVGILNITPNSFSDGWECFEPERALQRGIDLFNAGADILDIGAESTRPHHQDSLSVEEEWQRLYPVLQKIQAHWKGKIFRPKISVDTRSPIVAEKALHFDIDFINDVTGFTNPLMLDVVQKSSVKLIFMHHISIPPLADKTLPLTEDPIKIIKEWANNQRKKFVDRKIDEKRLIFDPGIGFGKTPDQSVEILKRANEFQSIGIPVLIGHSRKSFLEKFVSFPASKRDVETATLSTYVVQKNIDYLRVHHVEWTMRSLKIARALL